jgi:hypothetical protein
MLCNKKLCAAFVLVIALAAASFAQDTTVVQLIGYVSNWDGQPVKGAVCRLKNANLDTTTDTSGLYPGFFEFNALLITAVRLPAQKSMLSVPPLLRPDGLYFNVPQKMQPVKIDLFTLSGSKAFELVNSSMKPGNYRLSPFPGVKTSQTYVLRACIGDQTFYLRMPLAGNRIASSTGVQTVSNGMPVVPLGKKAAAVESLIVSAPGYVTNSWPLESYMGSHYVVLRTAAQAQNKVLSFTCSMNQGTTANDPQVTLCTAIFIQDMNNNYVNTMFVSGWLSSTGYAYKNFAVCPDWRGPDSTRWQNLINTDSTLVDAVTKATPILGSNSFEFNPNNFVTLTAGSPYRFCIEMNVYNQYNILFADSITLGSQPQVRTPPITYEPAKDPNASVDGLSGVVISYK